MSDPRRESGVEGGVFLIPKRAGNGKSYPHLKVWGGRRGRSGPHPKKGGDGRSVLVKKRAGVGERLVLVKK